MGSVESYDTAGGRRYRVRYRKPDHRQAAKRGFRTKRDAERFLITVESQMLTGDFIDPASSRVTVGELGPDWLDVKRMKLKPSSYKQLDDAWRVYVEPRWGAVELGAISHSDVQKWLTEVSAGTARTARRFHPRTASQASRPKSATVVIRAYGVLAAVLDVAVRDRRIPRNPARGVDLPRKNKKGHRYLTHAEVDRLAHAAGQDHSTVVYVAAYTGLRWGELSALRVRDLNLPRRRLAVNENAVRVGSDLHVGSPKTHELRSVGFPEFLSEPLAEAAVGKAAHALLFGEGETHLQRPRSSGASRSWFMRALADAGLPRMTIHDLRHTAASLAIASGANVKAVQRMLGHASAAMTLDVYADLFDDDLDAVSAAMNRARSAALVSRMCPDETRDSSSTSRDPGVFKG
ncbi:MAG: tyrosine-type recombinase/integrase [Microbacterium sp.]|uniref:tyrosine-type recombinase/integrase n=1 Tax=Microbacterium sp. TaxID=51671 RepID=UPI003F7F4DBE